MNNKEFHMTDQVETKEENTQEDIETEEKALSEAARMTTSRRAGRRGRKPAKVDVRAKLERSRQSARECRARKKLRYQYLEELVSSREKAIYSLRKELDNYKKHTREMDNGTIPVEVHHMTTRYRARENNGLEIISSDEEEEEEPTGSNLTRDWVISSCDL